MDESEIRFDDCGEMEPLNSSFGGTEPNTKCRRLLKTGLINMSFVAMVSSLYFCLYFLFSAKIAQFKKNW